MTELRDNINKLMEETSAMEKKQELEQELTEEEIIDWTHPMYQSQPCPDENQEEVEIMEEKCAEKNQKFITSS